MAKDGGEARKVSSDEDAWSLVEDWLKDRELGDVEFNNWPVLGIKINGDDYHASLNSGQMAALLDLKMVLGRTYSLLAHGAYDMRRLRDEEYESLQFTTKVKKGSSILETDFTPVVQAMAGAINAYPGFSVAAAAIIGLTFVARPLIAKHFENRAAQLQAEDRHRLIDLALNPQEKVRYRTFEQGVKKLERQQPQFEQVLPDARQSFWHFASASVDAEKVNLAGLELAQDDLEILAEKRTKRPTDTHEVKGVFRVASVKKNGLLFKVGLESKSLVINVVYRKPQLTDARIKRLMTCMANERLIDAKLNVKTVEQAQMSGRLMSFTVVAEEDVS